MSDYIPDHLIANVLLRLPFESLVRFRCVSKSWLALIDSPPFIKMHSKRSHLIKPYTHHPDSKIIALKWSKFYTFDSIKAGSSRAIAKEFSYPLEFAERGLNFVGSSNGLLCLWNFDRDDIFLWNPWIQNYSALPTSPYEYTKSCRRSLGAAFGYDHVNDDYKVVKWNTVEDFNHHLNDLPSSYRYELCAYSLTLNSWRRIGNTIPFELPEYYSFFSNDCAFTNGALHWLVTDWPRYFEIFILAFDLGSDEFRKISCGNCPFSPKYTYTQKLHTLNSCLSLLCFCPSRKSHCAVELWVMEDYGVEKSWIKLTSIEISPCLGWHVWPVAFSKKRRQLLLQIAWEKLMLYDLEDKTMREVAISDAASYCVASCICVGTLVRPCSYV